MAFSDFLWPAVAPRLRGEGGSLENSFPAFSWTFALPSTRQKPGPKAVLPETQMRCQQQKLKKNALKASLPRTPGCMRALASRSLTYERMQHAGSGCTSTGATCLQSRTGLIRFTQIFTDPSKTCSNAIGLGVSQKVTKRTKAEFGVNADTSFPSFAAVNLFWFAAVAASPACNSIAAAGRLRRGALGSATPGTATAAFPVLRRAGQHRGYNIKEPKW